MRLARIGAVVALLAWSSKAIASDPAVAREQLKIGYTLAQDGKCEEAVPHLVESLRLDPKAITLINLADCEEKVGKLTDAMGHWVDARARAQIEGAKPIEEEAGARAMALEPKLPRLTIVLAPTTPKDALVERDGIVLGAPSLGIPLPLDPGAHVIVVKAKGHADGTTTLTLAEGETRRIDVAPGSGPGPAELVASPAKRTSVSPLVFAGFGVAVVGTTVATITGLLAGGAASDAETACPNLRCGRAALDDVESGRRLGTVSTIAFAVAGVGLAVGLYGLFFAKPTAPPPSATSLAPHRRVDDPFGGRF